MATVQLVDPVTGQVAEVGAVFQGFDPLTGPRCWTGVAVAPAEFRCEFLHYNPAAVKEALRQAIEFEAADSMILLSPGFSNDESQSAYDGMYNACRVADGQSLNYQTVAYEPSLEFGAPTSVTLSKLGADEAVLQQSTIASDGQAIHTIYDPENLQPGPSTP